jgi:hypothetical protein
VADADGDSLALRSDGPSALTGELVHAGEVHRLQAAFDMDADDYRVALHAPDGELVFSWSQAELHGFTVEPLVLGPAYDMDLAMLAADLLAGQPHTEETSAQHDALQLAAAAAGWAALGESRPEEPEVQVLYNCGKGDCKYGSSEYCAAHDACCNTDGWLACATYCWVAAVLTSELCTCTGSAATAECRCGGNEE